MYLTSKHFISYGLKHRRQQCFCGREKSYREIASYDFSSGNSVLKHKMRHYSIKQCRTLQYRKLIETTIVQNAIHTSFQTGLSFSRNYYSIPEYPKQQLHQV